MQKDRYRGLASGVTARLVLGVTHEEAGGRRCGPSGTGPKIHQPRRHGTSQEHGKKTVETRSANADRKEERKRGRSPSGNDRRHEKRYKTPPWRPSSPRRSLLQLPTSTPLTATLSQILDQTKGREAYKWPEKMKGPVDKRDTSKYCEFHKDVGHTTDQCRILRNEIEELIRKGRLRHFIDQTGQENKREDRPRDRGNQGREPRGARQEARREVIHVLHGSSSSVGQSQRATKRYAREARLPPIQICNTEKKVRVNPTISFGDDDLVGVHQPHDDALVVTLAISNFEVKRILVDNGSAVNVIFTPALRKMGLDVEKLERTQVIVAAFNGEVTSPVGKIDLPVSVGEGANLMTSVVEFLVMSSPSAYNAIMGRPWLHEAGIIPSSQHQCLKLVVNHKVVTVRGSQSLSRECHAMAFKLDGAK